MKKAKQILLLLIFLLPVVIGCRKSPKLVSNVEISVTEIMFYHNIERGKNGLDQLKISPELMSSSKKWAEYMAFHDRMVHGSSYKHPQFKWGGENIAWGQTSIDEVMRGWMKSTGHRKNILNKQFTHAGFGYALASDGSIYWCAQFGGN